MANKIKGLAVVDSTGKVKHKILDDGNVEFGTDEDTTVDSKITSTIKGEVTLEETGKADFADIPASDSTLHNKINTVKRDTEFNRQKQLMTADSLHNLNMEIARNVGLDAKDPTDPEGPTDGRLNDYSWSADADANYSAVSTAADLEAAERGLDAAAKTIEGLVTAAKAKVTSETNAVIDSASSWADNLQKIDLQLGGDGQFVPFEFAKDMDQAFQAAITELDLGMDYANSLDTAETAVETIAAMAFQAGGIGANQQAVLSKMISETAIPMSDRMVKLEEEKAQLEELRYLEATSANPNQAKIEGYEAAISDKEDEIADIYSAMNLIAGHAANGAKPGSQDVPDINSLASRQRVMAWEMSTDTDDQGGQEAVLIHEVARAETETETEKLTVAGSATVDTLDFSNSKTALKIPFKTAIQANADKAAATVVDGISSQDGSAIYLTEKGAAPFDVAEKFYFCENGEWFMSPFVSFVSYPVEERATASLAVVTPIMNLWYPDWSTLDPLVDDINAKAKENGDNANIQATLDGMSNDQIGALMGASDDLNSIWDGQDKGELRPTFITNNEVQMEVNAVMYRSLNDMLKGAGGKA